MPEGLPDINLLPKYERESSNLFYIFIAIIVIVLLSYLFIGVYFFTTKSKIESAKTEYDQLSEKVDELQAEVNQLEMGGTSLAEAVSFVDNHNIPTSAFIEELTDLLPDHSYLSEYEYGSQVAEVTAHFETLDTVAGYTTNLITSDLIKDTKVDEVETFELKDEESEAAFTTIPRYEVDFTLQINKDKLEGAVEEDE